MFEREQQAIETRLREFIAQNEIPFTEAFSWLPIPFSGEWGISTSFFKAAAAEARAGKSSGLPVPQRAVQLAELAAAFLGTPKGFTHIEAVKGHLNLYFSSAEYSQGVIDRVLEQGPDYGHGAPKGQQVMVEFSQPNTHKAFHVGHLRSAILGDVISRILAFAGYDVIRANYPGDMGLHVIKWLWNYMNFHAGEKPETDTTRWMGEIYAEANKRLEQNPEFEAEIRALYKRWDAGDPEVVQTWQETRQWSLDGFNELYDVLDIPFDRYYFNSEMEGPGKQIVQELIAKGIAMDERAGGGTVAVKLDELLQSKKEQFRTLVVLRNDGTALYATEDLGLALRKFADYPNLTRAIYVVDVRQSLHFQQVFKTLELAGYEQAKKCEHLPYEIVTLPGNVVIASREGNVVLLEDLLREAQQRTLQEVQKKNPSLTPEQMEQVARQVGIAAIKFPLVSRDHTKIATFDWESALDFNGQAAPYIQYMHVRANSILRRLEEPLPGSLTPTHTLEPAEIELIDLISRLPGDVQRAAEELKTLHITNLAYEIARAFSNFYTQCQVLKAEPPVRAARLRLVAAARQSLANLLGVLGIQAPEVM